MDRQVGRSMLAGVELFAGLSDGALDDVLEAGRIHRVPKGKTLFRQGDPPAILYVLTAGRVKVGQITPEGQQVMIRFIGPGEMLGCVAVCGGTGYPGTATAVADSLAVGWSADQIGELAGRHSRIALNALGTVGNRLRETQSRLRELSTEKVERRVAHAILRLIRQGGRRIDEGVQITFPVSRQDIAEMTGTTLHTVSRILSGWEQNGLVSGGRRRIVVRRPHDLVAIAEDLDPA